MASMADQTLLQPFLAKPATKDSDSGIFPRIFSVIIIGAISLWANHEASKGFSITIINEAKETPSGKRFSLFFESDDTAVRLLLETSFFVERFLYDGVPRRLRKPVNHVTVRFNGNRSDVSVTSNASNGEYVIGLSSSLMKRNEFRNAVKAALRRSMVKVWLWGDESAGASPELVAGLVEYLAVRRRFDELGGYYWKDKESVNVARWLDYCERRSEGFIRRLNHGMRLRLDDQTVDLASNGACGSRQDVLRDNGFDD
ncbi:hypothetical protein Bca4012_028653 [Brassica carinata]|uniref:Uncharacterized protein n=3 Tax=Brassica TaxID=3705 RepID=A0A0D3BPG0_BRAOL|nr:PREDICTED: uncharacterized protein LOC106342730 [Brassica oleracea var. oleracea]KAG2290289.1 hypothetical protein Bca52824_049893 [Brassica carinata]VDD04489.1 unnamed protein product [Brassica oleracea]